ncbi:hypothetical protein C8F04DRAFT_222698 [Mycena alexandri]|uniref:Uncharacterized protein n=1 Tax=Mycena alexandri TaxID=1745969 RepID=A0AAD6TIE6_9AGAR|nr:hypothetical protein C8F04DRAFT_222698 [Mycena alexandri]
MLTIKEVLAAPFGPYQDSDILNPAWVPQGKKLAQLSRLRLLLDNKIIGLDSCERYLTSAKDSAPVFFLGVLVIDKLEWLSEAGKAVLQKELNKRDKASSTHRSSQNSQKATQPRHLSLGALYDRTPHIGFKLSIWIRCEKHSPAMFMTAKDYPQSLVLNSKNQFRSYKILSLERGTYCLSHNFFQRYRLVSLITEIMQKYRYPPNSARVDMLVTGYLMKHKEEGLSHAVIFAEDGAVPENPLLRHVSKAEVREIFAAHSGWLLAFYLKSPTCPLDIREWCAFVLEVRRAKRHPKAKDWSRTHEDDEIWASDPDEAAASNEAAIAKSLAKFGGTAAEWEKLLIRAITKPARSASQLFDDDRLPARSKHHINYDPDFSEPSTPGCSDAEYDSDSPKVPLSSVLMHVSQPPSLLPGRFVWDCPVPACPYSIDLLNDDIHGDGVSEVYVERGQFNDLRDEQVQKVLHRMVSRHYSEDHLRISTAKLQNKKQLVSQLMRKWRQ